MCFGGSSANTDRKTQLTAEGDLRSIYSNLASQGSSLIGKGATALDTGAADTGKASKYYSDILSGDTSKVMSAVAPEAKSLTESGDMQKKNIANFGNRTGGKIQEAGGIDDKTRASIADIIAKARGGAAGGLERTGSEASKVGLGLTGEGIGAESSAGGLSSDLAKTAAASRKTSQDIHDAAVQQWAEVVGAILFGV